MSSLEELRRISQTLQVGDVNSTEHGSGARFNAGKIPLDLIPLDIISWIVYNEYSKAKNDLQVSKQQIDNLLNIHLALSCLGEFQLSDSKAGSDDLYKYLYEALDHLGNPVNEIAQVFDYGRKKYAEWNWLKGMPWNIPLGCAARHLMDMAKGEVLDRESGLPLVGHIGCNIVMLITYLEYYPEGNNLPVVPAHAVA